MWMYLTSGRLYSRKNITMLYNVSSGDLVHYNEIGAFFAYRELMRHVNIYFPEIIPYELDDINIGYDRTGIPDVSIKAKTSYRKLDLSFFDDINIHRPFGWENANAMYENEEPDLPVILFLNDSFAYDQFIGKYFSNHFGKAIFIHYRSMEHFVEYIDRYKPDIVVFESAELELPAFANSVAGIPKL